MNPELKDYQKSLEAILQNHLSKFPDDGSKIQDKVKTLSEFDNDLFPAMMKDGQKVFNRFLTHHNDYRIKLSDDMLAVAKDIYNQFIAALSVG